MDNAEIMKKNAGYKAAEFVKEGMKVGLGTGSTARFLIEALIERVKNGLKIEACASSKKSLDLATQGHIPIIPNEKIQKLDLYIDGADEIDLNKAMIKGGGGALLREKLLATAAKEMLIIIDEHKQVNQLGKAPLPIEIVPFAFQTTIERLNQAGFYGQIRKSPTNSPYITDNGNMIYDIQLPHPIEEPKAVHLKLKSMVGVVETGLFFGLTSKVIVGQIDGSKILF